MLIVVNENNEIVQYASIGELPDSIEYDGAIPEDFIDKFKPSFYMIQDGVIVENPDYKEIKIPAVGPSTTEQQLAALGYQQMQDSQEKQVLIKQNAQMAYQIMQIQQQLGGQKA
ncbi:DUF2977 domain-containing protein [Pediococcus pentosaceus]|nr:DUF2977 domain-containing protein [Pediococcus pentosaceus]